GDDAGVLRHLAADQREPAAVQRDVPARLRLGERVLGREPPVRRAQPARVRVVPLQAGLRTRAHGAAAPGTSRRAAPTGGPPPLGRRGTPAPRGGRDPARPATTLSAPGSAGS